MRRAVLAVFSFVVGIGLGAVTALHSVHPQVIVEPPHGSILVPSCFGDF